MTTQNLIWQAGRFRIDLSMPKIMGIVNVTPDSFSDGGRYSSSVSQTLAHAEQLLAEGADMLDIGGESTRPGAAVVSPEEEWARVSPILAELSRWQVPVSLDTRRCQVMQQALEAGWVDIINDVQALEDEGAVELLAEYPSIGICLMHMQGLPQTMQDNPQYADVAQQVEAYLKQPLESRHFADQFFLREHIWPYAKQSLCAHDRIFAFYGATDFPDNTEFDYSRFHVGCDEGNSHIAADLNLPEGSRIRWSLFSRISPLLNADYSENLLENERLICTYESTVQQGKLSAYIPRRYSRGVARGLTKVTVAPVEEG